MERDNSFMWLKALVLLVVVVGQHHQAKGAIQCNDAVSRMISCQGYLFSGDAAPSAGCCSAVQSLDKIAAASPEDRRAICRCFKETARSFPVNSAKSSQLPQLCHVKLDVAIKPDVNCDRI